MVKRGGMRDARRSQRLKHELAVTYRSVGRFLSDWATDISRGGMYINTRSPLPVGTVLDLVVQLPGAAAPLRLAGLVKRAEAWRPDLAGRVGMAVEFTSAESARHDAIARWIEKVRGELEAS